MNQRNFDIMALKVADMNLQFLETITDLKEQLNVSDELQNMIDFIFELNFQQYRMLNEKLTKNDNVL